MKTRAFVVLGGCVLSSGAFAGKAPPPPPPAPASSTVTPGDSTRNKIYAGLKWDLPGPLAPSLVVGVRHAKTQSDGDTHGADLSMAFSFINGVKPGKLRLKAFTGNRDVQGELGGGFDFTANALFVGPSVNVPHVTLGIDWLLGTGLQPYGIIHTVGKPHAP
jgi:hypothetical protein